MSHKTSKRTESRNVSRVNVKHNNRIKLLNLIIKYLKNESNNDEKFRLVQKMDAIFKRRDQSAIDFISDQIISQYEDSFDDWLDFIDGFCSNLDGLRGIENREFKAVLFLIPLAVVIESDTKMKNTDDSFEIAKMGMVRGFMVKAGLISHDLENIGILTRLFSLDEVLSIDETTRYQLLEAFTYSKFYNPIPQNILQPSNLKPLDLKIKLKFIIGVATLKDDENTSPLSRLIDPLEFYDDKQMDHDITAMNSFTDALSEELPNFLKEKTGVNTTINASSIQEYSRAGIRSAINEFDEFKVDILLTQSLRAKNAKIKMSKPEGRPLEIILFDADEKISQIEVYCLFDSQEEMKEYFDELFEALEFRGFFCESYSDDAIVFIKKPLKDHEISQLH